MNTLKHNRPVKPSAEDWENLKQNYPPPRQMLKLLMF
ncbi:Uncharacterised protein [Neisseria animalis]|nr:Uncharacterised protein [Neisseria animalis]